MINIRKTCPELMIKARDELNEVESRIPEDISRIRNWIEMQPHLTARTDDQFLLSFLRGSKYSLEKAKSKIDSYYTIKSLSPELFLNKQIDEKTMRLLKLGSYLPLRDPLGIDGPRMKIFRYGQLDFDEFGLDELIKLILRIIDIEMLEDDNSIIGGLLNIVDMSSMTLATFLKFDLVLINKMGVFAEKAHPLRIKGVHFINFSKEALYIINVAQKLMPKNIKKRFFLHSSMESLYEHVPQKYLPKEYGGENGSFESTIDHWEKLLIQYKKFFDEDLKYGVNEKLRVGEKQSLESIFGLEGSFRKLEVD